MGPKSLKQGKGLESLALRQPVRTRSRVDTTRPTCPVVGEGVARSGLRLDETGGQDVEVTVGLVGLCSRGEV